ncbi:MAG: hypothetical protein JXA99_17765 [Candidatus Lokiarchaeota archaeon]|nr:hypothetical protein [Candidatus Lokiarchaeota archaeon]
MFKNYNKNTRIYNLTILFVLVYIALLILAMFTYTGGNEIDINTKGYSFFSNYFSDLGRIKSYSGNNNICSLCLFVTALISINIILIFFHREIMLFFKNNPRFKLISYLASIFGISSSIFAIFVPLFPEDIYPTQHILVTMLFSNLLVISFIFYAFIIRRDKLIPNYYFTLILVYIICLCIFLSFIMIDFGFSSNILIYIQATGQKIIIFFGFICIACLSYGMQNRIKLEIKEAN